MTARTPRPRRRWLVPEVVQTSGMDCGPAVLKCLLEGFGVPVHYDRLREACQTDVDGTSIDVLEEIARKVGLDAEQVMLPVDHLLLAESDALPAVLVVRQPNGCTHFVLAWRRHGPLVQVMDPGRGRRWCRARQLLDEVYVHTHRLPADYWYAWAASDGFLRPLTRRLWNLGLSRPAARAVLDGAINTGQWRTLAGLDAAARFVEALAATGGVARGRSSARVLRSLVERREDEAGAVLPDTYWSVRPAPPRADAPGEAEHVLVLGAVLVRVRGTLPSAPGEAAAAPALGKELAAALAEPPSRPLRTLLQLLRGTGGVFAATLLLALALAAGGLVVEAVLFRGLLELGRDLALVEQRLAAVGLVLGFLAVLLVVEWRLFDGFLRLGRRLETRLRVTFLETIPRLNDRYFQSRPVSDMAERNHTLHHIRLLPRLTGQFLRTALTLLLTAAAVTWFDPAGAPWVVAIVALALGVPLAFNPVLQGLDLRVRTHTGALTRFYMDALLGLTAIRAHGAERAVLGEHESLLVEWARASRRFLLWVVAVEGLQVVAGFGLAGWLLLLHAHRLADAGGILLLAYWVLNLPVLGEEISLLARQYPTHRSITLRLLDPLGGKGEAPDEHTDPPASPEDNGQAVPSPAERGPPAGVGITLERVSVVAGGHAILQDIDLRIEPGSQVAVVGPSGAGKSSLVGLLLGWHRPAAGRVLADGEVLEAGRLDRLRAETAWVDPGVQLWNRSLLDNLLYGMHDDARPPLGHTLHDADLQDVLRRLPDGLHTSLGEGGGLLSGGQGQRVRLGRALNRGRARLLILDEPFRGLDRGKRRLLLQRLRQRRAGATLLCITHDVGETVDFDRVLVIDQGRVAEDGVPAVLARQDGSLYRSLLESDEEVRRGAWSDALWRRLWLEGGRLVPPGQEGRG